MLSSCWPPSFWPSPPDGFCGGSGRQTLPGIGEKRAADIVADRAANGPYRYPEDLTRVSGIGEETLAGLLGQITTGEENG